MSYVQRSFDDVMVGVMRSELQTLRNYYNASTSAKGRAVKSVHVYAARVLKMANGILEAPASGEEAQRWARKIVEFCKQNGLGQIGPEA